MAVICLSGENDFGWRLALDEIVRKFTTEHGDMAVERLSADDVSFDRIRESLQTMPFLASRKLLVLRRPGAHKEFIEQLTTLFGDLPESTDVLIVEPKLDKRSVYYKTLHKITDFRVYDMPEESSLMQWLQAAARDKGGTLQRADAQLLIERVGANQQLLASELQKLLLYNPQINRSTIELLSEQTPQSTVFELLEAAFSGKAKYALALYRNQREQRVDPLQIIAMLTWQLRVLAVMKAGADMNPDELARASKLSPFVVRKSRAVASHLSLMRLRQLVQSLLEIDVRSKREGIDLDEALEGFFLQLAS